MATSAPAVYSLTKIKTFIGMEGHGLNAVILKNGKPICFVMDDASGGEVRFDFTNPGQSAKSYEQHCKGARAEEEAFAAFANAWYVASGEDVRARAEWAEMAGGIPFQPTFLDTMNAWVNRLVEEEVSRRTLKRKCAKSTLFRIPGTTYRDGEYHVVKAPFEPRVKAHLVQKYGPEVEILNERVSA